MRSPGKARTRALRLLRSALFLLYAFVVGGALTEICLRLGFPRTEAFERARWLRKQDPAGKRALILGDSFSPGGDGRACELLAGFLRTHGVETLNLAVPGTGPLDYLLRLRQFGVPYQPDLILLDYFVGNDLTNTLYTMESGEPTYVLDSLGSRSYLVIALRKVVSQLHTRYRRWSAPALKDPNRTRWTGPERLRPINPYILEVAAVHPDHMTVNVLMNAPGVDRAWNRNREVLKQVKEIADSIGARLVIAVFPPTTQVNDDHFEFYRAVGLEVSRDTLTSSLPQERMAELCRELRVECVDLLPEFRRRSGESLYIERDSHWNAEGNRLAFTVLRDALVARGLIPKTPRRR